MLDLDFSERMLKKEKGEMHGVFCEAFLCMYHHHQWNRMMFHRNETYT